MIFFKNSFRETALFAAAALTAGTSAFAEDAAAEMPVAPAEQAAAAAPVLAPENTNEAAMKALRESVEKLAAERAKLEAELNLADAKLEQELLPQKLEKARLDAERAQRSAAFAEKLAAIEEERAKLERELALATARAEAKLRAKQRRLSELETDSRELQARVAALNNELAAPAAIYSKKLEAEKVAPAAAPKYLKEPLVDGTLYISDRRVDFNGPVTPESAARVCRQIAFLNTRDTEYPIFLVIDNSPGGSVMAGYQIQKAMQSSRAPVYVVVKGMAASMAAVIATTAERSYCFANTKILHHQISSVFARANLTSLRESMRTTEEVYRMFIGPVAKKLGISVEEMTKQMYEHNSDGDWEVFGTEAVERRWIDFLVTRVEETSVVAIDAPKKGAPVVAPRAEAAGTALEALPPLENPFDRWWISGVE
ncbi:MAG: ATP-dependent Clp protease proteolytic subunit [Candidatus Spyradosoma sp.]